MKECSEVARNIKRKERRGLSWGEELELVFLGAVEVLRRSREGLRFFGCGSVYLT